MRPFASLGKTLLAPFLAALVDRVGEADIARQRPPVAQVAIEHLAHQNSAVIKPTLYLWEKPYHRMIAGFDGAMASVGRQHLVDLALCCFAKRRRSKLRCSSTRLSGGSGSP